MRLLDTASLELKEFYGTQIPPYAILSHTWGDDEVTFQDWACQDRSLSDRKGYTKIISACEQARNAGLGWIWIDTICIDKTSSAELSEAINSMYAWYRDSVVCYAHLADVSEGHHIYGPESSSGCTYVKFHESRWFTRGWTLQELLAPKETKFLSLDWKELRFETMKSRVVTISMATGIAEEYLDGREAVEEACVAEKMSWLSRRTTTRVEDIAYCALGIFDINMPLLYGEGKKAFVRLQEHIVQETNDHTIFCWSWIGVPGDWASMLAPHPNTFRHCGNLRRSRHNSHSPYSITNIGLSISAPVCYTANTMFVFLDARSTGSGQDIESLRIPLGMSGPSGKLFRRLPSLIAPIGCKATYPHLSSTYQMTPSLYPETLPRFYVQHKPRTDSLSFHFGGVKDFGKVCIVLFMSSDKEMLLKDREQTLLPQSMSLSELINIQGRPKESYFSGDSLLRLTYFRGHNGSTGVFAGVLLLSSLLSDTVYLFFVLEADDFETFKRLALKEESWYCNIVQKSSVLSFLKNSALPSTRNGDSLEDVDVLRLLVDDFQQRAELTARRQSDRYQLTLGHILDTIREEQQLMLKSAHLHIVDISSKDNNAGSDKDEDVGGEAASWQIRLNGTPAAFSD